METRFLTGSTKFHQTSAFILLDVDHGLNLVTAPHLRLQRSKLLRAAAVLKLILVAAVGNQTLRSSSRPKKVWSWHQNFSRYVETSGIFNIEGILGQCEKAQKINFCLQRWKSTFFFFYQLWACELHILCCHHVLKLVSPDMQTEAII